MPTSIAASSEPRTSSRLRPVALMQLVQALGPGLQELHDLIGQFGVGGAGIEQVEGGDARPAGVGPPGERQGEGRVSQVDDVEGRQAGSREVHGDRPGVGQQARHHLQAVAAPGAHDARRLAGVLAAAAAQDDVPRLDDDARLLAGHQLVAQRARGLGGLAHAQREQDVVEVHGGQRERLQRQDGRRLHLPEGARPARRHLQRLARRVGTGGSELQRRLAVRAEPGEGLERRRQIEVRGAPLLLLGLEGAAALEEELCVRRLVAGEDFEPQAVGGDRQQRIERGLGLGGLAILERQELLLRVPDGLGDALALGDEVGEVVRPVARAAAQVRGEHVAQRQHRVAHEAGIVEGRGQRRLAALAVGGQRQPAGLRGDLGRDRGGIGDRDVEMVGHGVLLFVVVFIATVLLVFVAIPVPVVVIPIPVVITTVPVAAVLFFFLVFSAFSVEGLLVVAAALVVI
ncbi:MAG: hypothetical protein QM765_29340 [Myxococcales bacterium]